MPNTPSDWRQSYQQFHVLPSISWAWEFLRRNATFTRVWSEARMAWEDMGVARSVRVVRIAAPKPPPPSPCLWASSPEANAFHAAIAWQEVSSTLKAVAVPPRHAFGASILDLESLAVEKTLIIDGEAQSLVLRDGPRSLQIDIRGTLVTDVTALFLDTGAISQHSAAQLCAFACLRDLRATGRLLEDHFLPLRRGPRLSAILQALDGHLAGASHREIATAVLGKHRVDRDWNDAGEHLRDYVRRSIASGLALVERGYRSFLR